MKYFVYSIIFVFLAIGVKIIISDIFYQRRKKIMNVQLKEFAKQIFETDNYDEANKLYKNCCTIVMTYNIKAEEIGLHGGLTYLCERKNVLRPASSENLREGSLQRRVSKGASSQ